MWAITSFLYQPAEGGRADEHLLCPYEKKNPTSSESPGDGIDSDEEESPRLSLPSSSSPFDSSVLVAHKDMALHTKSRTNHVQTSAESP